MSLTQARIKTLKPKSKTYTAADTGGLFLRIHPTGRLMWYYQFTFNKKRVRMNIGTYPEFTLAEARDARNGLAREVVRAINPKAEKQEAQREQFEEKEPAWFCDFRQKRSLFADV